MENLTNYITANNLVSRGAIEHAGEFLSSGYQVDDKFNNVPEALLLIKETYDGILVKAYNTMAEREVYTSLSDYEPTELCADLIPLDTQQELKSVILRVDDITRKVIVGSVSNRAIDAEKIRNLINNRKPGHEIIVKQVFQVSYHQWLGSLHKLKGLTYDDSMLKLPMGEYFKTIFRNAIESGATDISLEPYEDGMEVWYIIGKEWFQYPHIVFKGDELSAANNWLLTTSKVAQSIQNMPSVNSALQSLSEYDTHRGRLSKFTANFGPAFNIRTLPKKPEFINVRKLNYSDVNEAYLKDIAKFRQGVIMICGETNSGKNTTNYGLISEMVSKKRYKTISIENPIEYLVPRVIQVEAHNNAVYAEFAESLIRQSPDIAYFSEVSNGVILEHVMGTALTGKMVFSTMHAKDCANFFNRIDELAKGDLASQISSYMIAVITQKLIPKSCPDCRVPLDTDKEVPVGIMEVVREHEYNGDYFKNSGKSTDGKTMCSTCNGMGVKGIVPVAEYLDFDHDTAYKIRFATSKAEVYDIVQSTLKERGVSFVDDGLRLMKRGDVTLPMLVDRNIIDVKRRGVR